MAATAGLRPPLALLLALALALLLAGDATAKDPAVSITTAAVNVLDGDDVYYGTSAEDEDWGGSLPSQEHRGNDKREWVRVLYTTAALSDASGCTPPSALARAASNSSETDANSSSASASASASGSVGEYASLLGLPSEPFALLVDRGGCTFAEKALYAQQLGADALLITDTLQQAYNRSRAADATSDERALEFSCANGAAEATGASTSALDAFETDGWEQLVSIAACADSGSCASGRCIPSGSGLQVCCVWDIPDYMGFGASAAVPDADAISIPVIRITMADGYALKAKLSAASDASSSSSSSASSAAATATATGSTASGADVRITFYEREPPSADPAQAVLWLLAVATVLMGAYQGAAFERTTAQLQAALAATDAASSEDSAQARVAYEEHLEASAGAAGETLELSLYHAVGFLVLASGFLLLLFYVDVVLVVVVLFAVGAVSSSFLVLWAPLLARLGGRASRCFPMKNWLWQWEGVLEPAAWSASDLVALLAAVGAALFWFLTRHEGYSWVLQDVFGVCLSLVFLRSLRLPNVKVATVLLVLVFCYDIFMVFVSPYVFHTSVMIKVATSGASANADSAFCLRYPTDADHDCVSESMPILLRMPKVLDWRDSTTMLGLGDVVLPGLLLVLCARYDYATRGQLFGKVSRPLLERIKSFRTDAAGGGNPSAAANPSAGAPGGASAELGSDAARHSRRGITCLLLWGYALGLFLANLVVSLTGDGQPALMYLVPCTLGLLALVAWRRGIWGKLWSGPPELAAARAGSEADASRLTGALGLGGRPRGDSLESGKPASELVLMADHTPVSGSYARSEATPSQGDRDRDRA